MSITRVGTATASATTVTIPAHVAGDLILIWAVRGASATAPSLPSGYTSIVAPSVSTSVAVSGRLGYKIATGTGDTSGTWTNAAEICCHVYRASSGNTVGIGQNATSTSTTATITYPAITLADTSGNSWVTGFVGASDLTQTISTAPSGMTNESAIAGASYQAAGHDTTAGVSSWSVQTVASGATGHSVSAVVELLLLPTGSVSNVYQHVGGGGNPYTRGNSGNSYLLPLPNSSGAGNAIILAITYDAGATPTVTDNINGTWAAASVSTSGGAGNLDSKVYVFPNVTAGLATITVAFGSATRVFQYCVTELYGVATSSPANGTSSAAYSTTTASGSFTPGNNNANGGNFIWSYFAKAEGSGIPAHLTTRIAAPSPFTLLSADIGWANANDSLTKAVTGYVQATSAAINPSITSVADSGDHWNSLSVALKISSGAGTAPVSGIRMGGVQHFATEHFASSGTYVLQVPTTGNLRVIMSDDPSLHAQTVTDSEGNTWTADGQSAGFWYFANATANPNLFVFLTGGGADATLSWRFADIAGAATSPFDSAAASNQTVNSVTSFTASPSPSPSNTNGMVIVNIGLGQGPGLGITAPSGTVWDLCTYTGETDLDLIENADIMGHYKNSASGSETWTFSITSEASNSTSGGFIAFAAASTSVWPISDSSATSDAFAGICVTSAALTDTVATSDAIAAALAVLAALSDTAATTDATGGAASAHVSDTAATADGWLAAAAFAAALADLAATSDVLAGAVLAAMSDAIATSDAAGGVAGAALADTTATSDALAAAAALAAALADTTATADTWAAVAKMLSAVTDATATSDTLSAIATLATVLSDSTATADTLAASARAALSDTAATADVWAAAATLVAILSDSTATADTWVGLLPGVLFGSLADTSATADAFSAILVAAAALSDSVATATTWATAAAAAATLSDTTATADSVAGAASAFMAALADLAATSDLFSAVGGNTRLLVNLLFVVRAAGMTRVAVATGFNAIARAQPITRTATWRNITMAQAVSLSPMDVGEVRTITFDFAGVVGVGELLSGTPTVLCTLSGGTDPTPSARLIGSPQLTSSPSTGAANMAVLQQIGTMRAGATYAMQCLATAAPDTSSLWVRVLCVQPA